MEHGIDVVGTAFERPHRDISFFMAMRSPAVTIVFPLPLPMAAIITLRIFSPVDNPDFFLPETEERISAISHPQITYTGFKAFII